MRTVRTLLCIALLTCAGAASPHDVSSVKTEEYNVKTVKLFEGVSMHVPRSNATENKIVSFEIATKRIEEGRGQKKQNLMERILPMFIMPFLIQSTIVPMFLSMLKFMLFKSAMVGKLALALILFNAFRNHNTFKARDDAHMANVHYGYHGGMEEYGAFVN